MKSLVTPLLFFGLALLATVIGGENGESVVPDDSTEILENDTGTPRNNNHFLRGLNQAGSVVFRPEAPIHQVPFTASAFQANEFLELSQDDLGTCDRGPTVDAQFTSDPVCQQVDECNLGWTERGERLTYYFDIPEPEGIDGDYYFQESVLDVTLRLASLLRGRNLLLEFDRFDGGDPVEESFAGAPGLGWQVFEDDTRRLIQLPYRPVSDHPSQHRLDIIFEDGAVNLCAVTIEFTRRAPFTAAALDFYTRYEAGGDKFLGDEECNSRDPVDAQLTADSVCNQRDGSSCNIGWTEPGDWVVYPFVVEDNADYNVWARIASHSANRRIRLNVSGPWKGVNPVPSRRDDFYAPGLGWQEFEDVVWDSMDLAGPGLYRLQVMFLDGGINLCSVQVQRREQV